MEDKNIVINKIRRRFHLRWLQFHSHLSLFLSHNYCFGKAFKMTEMGPSGHNVHLPHRPAQNPTLLFQNPFLATFVLLSILVSLFQNPFPPFPKPFSWRGEKNYFPHFPKSFSNISHPSSQSNSPMAHWPPSIIITLHQHTQCRPIPDRWSLSSLLLSVSLA